MHFGRTVRYLHVLRTQLAEIAMYRTTITQDQIHLRTRQYRHLL